MVDKLCQDHVQEVVPKHVRELLGPENVLTCQHVILNG